MARPPVSPAPDARRRLRQYDELPGEEPEAVFPLPEDLTAIPAGELRELEEQAVALFDELRAGDLDAEAVSQITQLRDAIVALRAEGDRRTAEATERQAAIEAMDAEIHPQEETEDADDGDPDEGEPEPEGEPEEDPEKAEDPEKVPVAASAGRRAPLGQIARRAPAPRVRPTGGRDDEMITITAAADLPGVTTGARFDTLGIAKAMHDKARLLPTTSPRVPIATVEYGKNLPEWGGAIDRETIDRATNPEALTAAGGWCGPLTPFYNLFRLDGVQNLLDLPTVRVARAGISVPSPLVMPANLQTLGFQWDRDNDIAAVAGIAISNLATTASVTTVTTGAAHNLAVGDGVTLNTSTAAFSALNGQGCQTIASVPSSTTFTIPAPVATIGTAAAVGTATPCKPCVRIPCPTWTDYYLMADGVCVTHGNLADRSFPEMTREYVNLVMNAHEILMSQKALAIIDTASGAAVNTPEHGSAFSAILGAVDLLGEFYRETYRMDQNSVLEGIFPQWTVNVMRQDLAARANGLDPRDIPLARIRQEFTDRNVRPQFISHYQMLAAATTWPSTLNFQLYAPGTFVKGTGGSIDLGVVRDMQMNATNDFTAAWSEEFWLLAQLGPNPVEGQVTLPPIGCNTANCV